MLLSALATGVSVGMLVSQLTVIGELRRAQATQVRVPMLQSLASFLSSVVWTKYGLIKDDTAVAVVNGLGTAIAIYILGCFWHYSAGKRRQVESGVLVTVVLAVALVGYVDYATDVRAVELFSMVCCFMSLVFLGSPLSQIGHVVRTRDASVLLPSVALLALATNILWAMYGAERNDPFMVVPNLVGSVFCSVQLGLIAYYGRAMSGPPLDAADHEEVKLDTLS
ncbi:hypothetical protein H4R19_000998 [Coemansia spiralis]|nr:hypothetical protein H4R19_000998 [Coemansia spiralis]